MTRPLLFTVSLQQLLSFPSRLLYPPGPCTRATVLWVTSPPCALPVQAFSPPAPREENLPSLLLLRTSALLGSICSDFAHCSEFKAGDGGNMTTRWQEHAEIFIWVPLGQVCL